MTRLSPSLEISEADPPSDHPHRRSAVGHLHTLTAAVVYLAIAVVANWPAWSHGVSHSIQTTGASDVQQEVWYFAQTPWSIIHGINPFGNGLLNAPVGINLMDNTSMPLLGLIAAPITLLLGPLATYNVLLDLAFASSALAFYLMARRFVRSDLTAFLGGLLYGYSPYSVAVGTGHIFLVCIAVPPLVVLLIDCTLRTRELSPLRGGVLLGAALIAQFYISSEIFACTVLMIAVAGAVLGLYWLWQRPEFDTARLIRFGVAGIGVCALGVGYGAWMAVSGPNHISGPAEPPVAIAGLSNDPLGLVVPSGNQRFAAGFAATGDRLVAQRDGAWHIVVDAPSENGSYIGIPLLCLLMLGAFALRHRRLMQFCVAMATSAMVLSLGSRLHVGGRLTPIRLPFDLLTHLPLLDSSIAARYVLFFWLFAALMFAVILDRLHAALAATHRPRPMRLAATGSSAVALIALLPLVPAWPYAAARWSAPAWFTHTARSLPVGSTVVVYPMASPSNSSAMVWQAQAEMKFRMPGGYSVFRSASGAGTPVPQVTPIQTALALCTEGKVFPVPASQVRALVRSWHVAYVVVPKSAPYSSCASELFDRSLGAARSSEGVYYWQPGA